jgi:hypothetical protein
MAFLCVSQQGEFKNTIKPFWGKSMSKKVFSCRLFPSTFFIAFLAVSLDEEPQNTIKIFSKIRPENLQKSPKKVGRSGTSVFFFPLGAWRPLEKIQFEFRIASSFEQNARVLLFAAPCVAPRWMCYVLLQGAFKKKKIESDVYLADGQ